MGSSLERAHKNGKVGLHSSSLHEAVTLTKPSNEAVCFLEQLFKGKFGRIDTADREAGKVRSFVLQKDEKHTPLPSWSAVQSWLKRQLDDQSSGNIRYVVRGRPLDIHVTMESREIVFVLQPPRKR